MHKYKQLVCKFLQKQIKNLSKRQGIVATAQGAETNLCDHSVTTVVHFLRALSVEDMLRFWTELFVSMRKEYIHAAV